MKRITFSRKQILRAIHAACVALFFAACANRAAAAPVFSPAPNGYTVNGSNVTGSGTNTTSAYFLDSSNTTGYAVAIAPGADLVNSTGKANHNELEFDNGSVTINGTSTTTGLFGTNSAIYIRDDGTVTNSGYLGGGNFGLEIGGNGSVTNNSTGLIISTTGDGLLIGGNGTLNNAGEITTQATSKDAVNILGNGTVNNTSTGILTTFSGYSTALAIGGNGQVTNAGMITSSGKYVESIFIMNTGTISNSSTGTISANGKGADAIVIQGNGTVTNAGQITATGAAGVFGGGSAVDIVGDGTVINQTGGTISGFYGVLLESNGTVTNSGSIQGTGTTTGTAAGVFIMGNGTITNNASGTISGQYGVTINGIGTVINSGSITSSTKEAVAIGGSSGSVTNHTGGTISGYDVGILFQGNGTVTNSGTVTITGPGTNSTYVAIVMEGKGTVVNQAGGVISGTSGNNSIGIDINGTANVVNAGAISGTNSAIYVRGGGTVNNSGLLHAQGPALVSAATPLTVFNSGIIKSNQDEGIKLTFGGNVTLAGGSILSATDSVDLNSATNSTYVSTVSVLGRTHLTGDLNDGKNNGTLNLNLVGLTPAEVANLHTAVLTANSTTKSGTYTIGSNTYAWSGFTVNDNAISLELAVDSGLAGAAKAIDNDQQGLPAAYDPFYVAASLDPEAALNELVGRQIDQGLDTLGVSRNTTLASDINQHLDGLLTGNQIGGFDLGGMHINDAGSLYAFSNTSAQLSSLVGMAASGRLAADTLSTDGPTLRVSTPQPSWGIWASGDVTIGNQSSTGTLTSYHSTLGSPTLGIDFRVTPHFTLGALFNYTTSDANFGDGSQINSNTELGALYGTWHDGNWHVNGIAGAGATQYDNHRTTFGATADSSPGGNDILTDWTGGYDFHLGDQWSITPEVGLQYTHLDINSYAESGAGVFDLAIGSQEIDSLRSHVGFKIDKAYRMGKDLTFIPELRALWYHEYLDDSRGVNTSLPGSQTPPVAAGGGIAGGGLATPGTVGLGSFAVDTFSPQRDFALLGVGLNTAFTGYKGMPVGMFLNYNVQVGQSNYISHSVNTGIRVDF